MANRRNDTVDQYGSITKVTRTEIHIETVERVKIILPKGRLLSPTVGASVKLVFRKGAIPAPLIDISIV